MDQKVERLLSATLTLSALLIGVSLVHREFFAPPSTGQPQRKSEFVADWKAALPISRIQGKPDARVTVVEFVDFQCPSCRRFNGVLQGLLKKYPNDVNLAFVHFPLNIHGSAEPAAHASECAAQADRFREIANLMFEKQDSLGKKTWASFASEAGIADTASFKSCMNDSTTFRRVRAGVDLANATKVQGTPTIILNGWRYGGIPADTELVRAVDDILSGRKPYRGFRLE
jgi:protein-disulfide isomerase